MLLAAAALAVPQAGGPGAEDAAGALFPMEEFQIPDSVPARVQEKVRREILPEILHEMDPWPGMPSQVTLVPQLLVYTFTSLILAHRHPECRSQNP